MSRTIGILSSFNNQVFSQSIHSKAKSLRRNTQKLKAAILRWRRRHFSRLPNKSKMNSAATLVEEERVKVGEEKQQKEPKMTRPSSPPSYDSTCPTFTFFSELPVELRMKIWEAAMESRIVRWTRRNNQNLLTAPSRSLPLMLVSREAREAAFLYGTYLNLADTQNPVYFSPKIDYLWFDPGWTELGNVSTASQIDPLERLLPKLGEMQNIMVHPNWSGERRRPTVLFGKLPSIRKVLVAADEKSIGLHGKVMLETVKEIQSYYARLKDKGQVSMIPYVAVGCVGWVGEERRKLHHGSEDTRQLVKIFEKQWEMNIHLHYLREEGWQFTHNHLNRPKIIHKLRFVRDKEGSERKSLKNAEEDSSITEADVAAAKSSSAGLNGG